MKRKHTALIDKIIEAADRHGLRLDATNAQASDGGLDFFAVFAQDHNGQDWVVRSPRRTEVVERAKHESKVLTFIKPRIPASVPEWRIHTDDVIAYPKLAGVPAAEVDPEAKAYVWHVDPSAPSPALIRTTAEALATLHTIDSVEISAAGFLVPDIAGVRETLAGQMEQVRREFGVLDTMWRRWQTWIATEDLWPPTTTFIHGDFHAGHMLVDSEENLVGVLDWTEGGVGDPTVDLAVFRLVFGEGAFATLIEAYITAGGRIWPRINEHVSETLAASPAKIGVFALASGRDEHIAMAKEALGVT